MKKEKYNEILRLAKSVYNNLEVNKEEAELLQKEFEEDIKKISIINRLLNKKQIDINRILNTIRITVNNFSGGYYPHLDVMNIIWYFVNPQGKSKIKTIFIFYGLLPNETDNDYNNFVMSFGNIKYIKDILNTDTDSIITDNINEMLSNVPIPTKHNILQETERKHFYGE